MSWSFVLYGTIVTLHPILFNDLIIFNLIPQSIATTLNSGLDVLEYHLFLQLTTCTASLGIVYSLSIFIAFCLEVEISVIKTFLLPFSLILLVIFLVSTPEIPGILFSSKYSESVFVYLKLLGWSLYSLTIRPPIVGCLVS